MRPRKRVLLWDADAEQQGRIAYVLAVGAGRFAVVQAPSLEEAVRDVRVLGVDGVAVICRDAGVAAYPAIADLLDAARSCGPRVPTLLALGYAPECCPAIADVVLERWTMSELIERLRVLCARRRGPRPGTPRPPRASKVVAAKETVCRL